MRNKFAILIGNAVGILHCKIPEIKSYDAFDEYHVKHYLSAMEKLFAGYVNARLDKYLKILQD